MPVTEKIDEKEPNLRPPSLSCSLVREPGSSSWCLSCFRPHLFSPLAPCSPLLHLDVKISTTHLQPRPGNSLVNPYARIHYYELPKRNQATRKNDCESFPRRLPKQMRTLNMQPMKKNMRAKQAVTMLK